MSADNIQIGARVVIKGKPGVVKFIGTTKFAPGEWVGVELDMPYGKNNGAVDGTRYFKCDKPISQGFFGIFVHPNLVDIYASKFWITAKGPHGLPHPENPYQGAFLMY